VTDLLEWSGRVRKLVEQSKNVASTSRANQSLMTREEQVAQIREDLDNVERHRGVLAEVGISPISEKKATSALIAKCRALTDLVENDWELFAGDTSFFAAFKDPCAKIAQARTKALTESWTTYAEGLIATVPKDLLAGVGLDELGQEIRQAFNEAKALASKLPADPSRARDLANSIKNVISKLERVDKIPGSVKVFLERTHSEEGAGLEDLTDEVRAWLAEEGRLSQFRVFFKETH
jgi:hypothetical protein